MMMMMMMEMEGGLTEHLWDGDADSEGRAHDVGFPVDVGGS